MVAAACASSALVFCRASLSCLFRASNFWFSSRFADWKASLVSIFCSNFCWSNWFCFFKSLILTAALASSPSAASLCFWVLCSCFSSEAMDALALLSSVSACFSWLSRRLTFFSFMLLKWSFSLAALSFFVRLNNASLDFRSCFVF